MARKKRRSGKRRQKNWNPVKHPGSLKRLGYDPDDKGPIARHRALARAVRTYGYRKTVQKLAFLKGAAAVPADVKRNVAKDLEWLKEKFGKKRQKSR